MAGSFRKEFRCKALLKLNKQVYHTYLFKAHRQWSSVTSREDAISSAVFPWTEVTSVIHNLSLRPV